MSYYTLQTPDYQSTKILQFCKKKETVTGVHIGKLIKERAEELNIGATELARRISTGRQNIYDIYDRESIDTKQLSTICEVLDYDFFSVYQNNLKRYSSLQDQAAKAEEKAEVYFRNNKILLESIKKLEHSIKPQDRKTLVSRITILQRNRIASVVLKDLSVKVGSIYIDKETGDHIDPQSRDAIHAFYLVPPKSQIADAEHIQVTMDKADKEIYKMIGEYIELEDVHAIHEVDTLPKK